MGSDRRWSHGTQRQAALRASPLKNGFKRFVENARDAEGGMERRRVFSGLDGGDGLARHADPGRKIDLRVFGILAAAAADLPARLPAFGEGRSSRVSETALAFRFAIGSWRVLKRVVGASAVLFAACATGSVTPATTLPSLKASAVSVEDTIRALAAMCLAEGSKTPKGQTLTREPGMGTGGFKIDSASADAQSWFDYGLQLSHSFYHEDAKRAMKAAAEADPTCAMCAWGEAWTLGPTLNYQIDEAERVAARAAADRARTLVTPADARGLALIEAIQARYAEGKPGVSEPAFGKAMLAIAHAQPDEAEIAVLASHALLIPVRADNEQGLKPALALLESVLAKLPNDTGAIHYYIHATEFDGRAEDAIAFADRLGELAPGASHLVHMPAHTFFHAGRYQEAAVVNAEAIGADGAWIAAGGDGGAPAPMYYAHNLAFGVTAALMSGDRELALKYASHAQLVWPETMPADRRGYPVSRTYAALGRYAPDKAMTIPEAKEANYRLSVYRHYARGEAMLTSGDVAGARAEARAIGGVKHPAGESEPMIARNVLEGRIAMLEGNAAKATRRFLAAANEQETKLADSWDPPLWWYPVRRSVAAAHLKAGDFVRAEMEAKVSLSAWKHDPLALWVLGKAQIGQGRMAEGGARLDEARRLWRGDFDSISVEAI